MKQISIDLSTCPSYGARFDQARDKVREFVDYTQRAGRDLKRIQVYPADHKALIGAVNTKFKKDAREQTRALREQNKRNGVRGKIDPIEPDVVSDIHWGGGACPARGEAVKAPAR